MSLTIIPPFRRPRTRVVFRRQGKKGSVIGERFEVREDVGLGTFGRVVECWDLKRKRHVAVKVVRKVNSAPNVTMPPAAM